MINRHAINYEVTESPDEDRCTQIDQNPGVPRYGDPGMRKGLPQVGQEVSFEKGRSSTYIFISPPMKSSLGSSCTVESPRARRASGNGSPRVFLWLERASMNSTFPEGRRAWGERLAAAVHANRVNVVEEAGRVLAKGVLQNNSQ